jgi:hypothetical protein
MMSRKPVIAIAKAIDESPHVLPKPFVPRLHCLDEAMAARKTLLKIATSDNRRSGQRESCMSDES